ncbi:hypothetical protein [Massilicoli timonensis]|uniref:hypothetical protein n=1 Tax=Massilicoli timonensis TaxID=2015901 RepID=UPI000C85CB06|nr:hypothetical protein [Massilicoli timonensis]
MCKKKEELIRTFYIPNTKEEIYEFFILASSNIKIGGMNTNAWMVKIEQAYQKAELSFGNTSEFERLKSMYVQIKKMNKKNYAFNFFKSKYAWALIFFIIGIFFFLVYSASNNENIGVISLMFIVIAAGVAIE